MPKKECNNCSEELEALGGESFYCKECDETYTIKKGKQEVPKEKTSLKDVVKSQGERLRGLEKEVTGKAGEDFYFA